MLILYISQLFAYCDETLNHGNEILVLSCPNFNRNAALKIDSYAEDAVKILNEMTVLSLNLLASNSMGIGGHDDVIKWKLWQMERWCFLSSGLENKGLSKQSRRWWFETPPCSLWRE